MKIGQLDDFFALHKGFAAPDDDTAHDEPEQYKSPWIEHKKRQQAPSCENPVALDH